MKRLFIIILLVILPSILYAQKAYLTGTSTTLTKSNPSTSYTIITIKDSSNSVTDTCVAEVYYDFFNEWLPIAVQDLGTHDDWYTSMIPGDGEIKSYLVNYLKLGNNFRVRKTNAANPTIKTKIQIGGIQ